MTSKPYQPNSLKARYCPDLVLQHDFKAISAKFFESQVICPDLVLQHGLKAISAKNFEV
jgi:hypothetical protein